MSPPLIAHVIHHLVIGGLENGLVNLINRMPEDRYRHAIVCVKDYSDFRNRIRRPDVEVIALHRQDGRPLKLYGQLYRVFKELKPTIVHSRNMTGLDSLLPATLAGVPIRIHGEHGRDMNDPDGSNRKYRLLRKLHSPFVQHYVAVSSDLAQYLGARVGIAASRITQIYNGVDTQRFAPPARFQRTAIPGAPFPEEGLFVVGTVGRFQPIKDQATLVRAFARARALDPRAAGSIRLALVGDGAERLAIERTVREAGLSEWVWMPGAREDVPEVLRGFDLFVLPSRGEGISNTILEAMASGLPVVATRVGGNPELVAEGSTGALVPPEDPEAIAKAMLDYVRNPSLRTAHATAARRRAEQCYSLDAMIASYTALYDRLLARAQRAAEPRAQPPSLAS